MKQVRGDNFCCMQFPAVGTHLSVFHTDLFGPIYRCTYEKNCPQPNSKHAKSKLWVIACRCHRKTLAWGQWRVNPPKESRLAVVDLWTSCTSACRLPSYCEVFTDNKSLYTANLHVYWHICRHGTEYTKMWRASYCPAADNLRAACNQVAINLCEPMPLVVNTICVFFVHCKRE